MIYIFIAIFIASIVHFIIGFADAMILMPILLIQFSILKANILASLYAFLMGLFILYFFRIDNKSWKAIKSEMIFVIVFYCIGTFLGFLLFKFLINNNLDLYLKHFLGMFLIFYPFLYIFFIKKIKKSFSREKLLIPCIILSILSGFMGIVIGVNGPPLVIYLMMRKFDRVSFIWFLQPIFMIGAFVNLIMYSTLAFKDVLYLAVFITLISPIILFCGWGIKKMNIEINSFEYVLCLIIFISGLLLVF